MKPQLIIDCYKAGHPYSGLGQFSIDFGLEIMACMESDLKNKVPFDIRLLIPRNLQSEVFPKARLIQENLLHRYLPFCVKPYAIWHSLHQFPSHFPHPSSIFILTIHDLNFLVEKSDKKRQRYLRKLQENIDRADFITAISHTTKTAIETNVSLKGKEVAVIYNGVNLHIYPGAMRPSFLPEGPFFLSIGLFSDKKNFHLLIPILKYFPNYKLVLAGKSDNSYGRKVRALAEQAGVADRLVVPGIVTDVEKYWLYHHCEAFFLPSKAEGFGLPVIEAMRAGKLVFLSKEGSLPEIGGEYAYYFDSFREEEMGTLIKKGLREWNENPKLKESVLDYSRQFSWSHAISAYLELYLKALSFRHNQHKKHTSI